MRHALRLALAVLPALTAALIAAPAAAGSRERQVGTLTLRACHGDGWCGVLPRALDPRAAAAGTVPVYFEYYPHQGIAAATGTLVATEGGPGYPTTDSRQDYLGLFAPLRERYDVLLMDNRGTGRSGAVDCRALQRANLLTPEAIGECGRSLGARAPLYATALATDDLAAILQALGIGRVALYGNSYGTYFAQTFALRHGAMLRAMVLDGAYGADSPADAWVVNYAPAMRDKFNVACARSPACAAIPGSSLQHIAPALAQLRARPFAAHAPGVSGRRLAFTADASALAIVMFGGAPATASLRETDAAARAFGAGDTAPLLRLMAETLGSVDSRDATGNPRLFSAGLAAAVTCHDTPQIFDMHLPPALRRAQRDALLVQRRRTAPDTYAPFTIDEYRAMPADYAFLDQCVDWPALPAGAPAPGLPRAQAAYPAVPVLVISGEFDDMTPVADGAAAAAHFVHATHLVVANGFHVNALPRSRGTCAARSARQFLDTLRADETPCAAPPVTLLPQFARQSAQLQPALPLPGNRADGAALRVVSAALLTAADAVVRVLDFGAGPGAGLRGGSFAAVPAGEGYRIELREARWTDDVAISGRIDWPGREGTVRARLRVSGPGARHGELHARWQQGGAQPAVIHGTLAGSAVAASLNVP
ncbi:MAG: alpha/beta fold hydrolase [Proteobacteria bacterium]|nr:alpha/beta fold hydrolase [Pseudomonadota bacterium]